MRGFRKRRHQGKRHTSLIAQCARARNGLLDGFTRQGTDLLQRQLELRFVIICTFLLLCIEFAETEPGRERDLIAFERGRVSICNLRQAVLAIPSVERTYAEERQQL